MARLDINFYSTILKREVNFLLIYPSLACGDANNYHRNYYKENKNNKFPLLLLFHGYGGSYLSYEKYSNIDMYAEENNICVCMISGENKSYLNHKNNDLFYDFISIELLDYLHSNFNISDKKEDNFIAGLSMGGFGALYIGLKNSNVFSKIGAFSPGILMGRRIKSSESEEILYNLALKCKKSNKLPEIYISIGDKDDITGDEVSDFINFLEKNNIRHKFKLVKNYGHEWRLWDKEIDYFISHLRRCDFYKDDKKAV